MWPLFGFLFSVAVFFTGYAVGWTHGRDDLLDEQARARGEGEGPFDFEDDEDE